MDRKLNIADRLDFSEIDLTEPDKVIEDILGQLNEETQGIVTGEISAYNGPVMSYNTVAPSMGSVISSLTQEKHVDIQDSLGKVGAENQKFECSLYTACYAKYRYRIFFMQYGIAHYPVQFILEESIAHSIGGNGASYIFTCNRREEVEDLIFKILYSKKVIGVMQELIRIYQAKKESGELARILDTSVEDE